jgi:large subunit ribosomal protein L25
VSGDRTRLEVRKRDELGSRHTRRLRKQGVVPGVLYGRSEPVAIAVGERELRAALTGPSGLHAVLDVVVDGGATHASILKDYQQDALRGRVTHIDLQEVRLDQEITTTVAVVLVGESPGDKAGGVLSQPTTEVTITAKPLEVPEHIEADVSDLDVGGTLRLADLAAPEGVTLTDDPELVIATVTAPTREVEPEEAAETAEGAPEAEQAPEGAAEEPAGGEAAGEPGTVEG